MQDEVTKPGEVTTPSESSPLHERALTWAQHIWRPVGTSVAVSLILLVGWGVVNGKHGLSAWQQQRVTDMQLKKEIDDLQQENARLRDHVERLKSDPNAIEHEAREQLHYAKPGEVIYTLPAQPQTQTQTEPVGSGK
jgi:cell division protein FtsB